MTKKIIAALLLVVVCTTGLLAGCGATPVTEDDFDRIATYYFDKKVGEGEWVTWRQDEDVFVQNKDAYCMSAVDENDEVLYTIAIAKDGSGVYRYGLVTGKTEKLGGCNVGK